MNRKNLVILPALLALLATSSPIADAKPGGRYQGTSKANTGTPGGGTPMPFGNIPINLKLPNRKGNIKGTLEATKATPPFGADVPITGRVTKVKERQGGKKFVLSAKWTWALGAAGLPGTATGKGKIKISQAGRGYKIKPGARINLSGIGGADFRFTAKVCAKK